MRDDHNSIAPIDPPHEDSRAGMVTCMETTLWIESGASHRGIASSNASSKSLLLIELYLLSASITIRGIERIISPKINPIPH